MARQVLKGMKNVKGKEWNTPPKGMKNAEQEWNSPQGTMKCLGISYHISLGGIEKTVQATAYILS